MFNHYKKVQRTILETTLRLLTDYDLQATSMAMISKESGISIGSIYHHFSSKEEIINELYRGIAAFQTDLVLKDYFTDIPIRERFETAWRRVFETGMDYPDAFRFLEQYSLSPYIYEESKQEAFETNWCKTLADLYNEAALKGLFIGMNPRLMVQMHYGNAVFLVKAYLQNNLDLNTVVIRSVIGTFWNSVSTAKGFGTLSINISESIEDTDTKESFQLFWD